MTKLITTGPNPSFLISLFIDKSWNSFGKYSQDVGLDNDRNLPETEELAHRATWQINSTDCL